MEHIAVKTETRPTRISTGKKKELRRNGFVLGSFYGRGVEPVSLIIRARNLVKAVSTEAGLNAILDVEVNGVTHTSKIATWETDGVTGRLMHVGLHKIETNTQQKANVHVELDGEPSDVHNHVGQLEVAHTSVEVRATAENLEPVLHLDISQMEVGDVLRAGDITLPAGHELLTDPEEPIVSVKAMVDMEAELDAELEAEAPTVEATEEETPAEETESK